MYYSTVGIALLGLCLVGTASEAQFQPGTPIRYLTRTDSVVPFEGEYAGRIADTILVGRPKAPLEPLVRVPVDSITEFSYWTTTAFRDGPGGPLIGGSVGFLVGAASWSDGSVRALTASVFRVLALTVVGAFIGSVFPAHEWRAIDPHLIQVTGDSAFSDLRLTRLPLDERLAVQS